MDNGEPSFDLDELLAVVLHEVTNAIQGMPDKAAVIRDPFGVQHRRVQRFGVAQNDVLRPVGYEKLGRPIRKRILVERHFAQLAGLELGAEFWERRKIIKCWPLDR